MKRIEVIGLGSSDLAQMPLGIWQRLTQAEKIHLRTKDHPAVQALEEAGMVLMDFDEVYEQHDSFEGTYRHIVDTLLDEAAEADVLYAVPGHPLFYETTTELLMQHAAANEVELKITGGQSFIDAVVTALEIPVNEGFQVIDGMNISIKDLNHRQHTLVTQVYDQHSLGEAKLSLLEYYPADTAVQVVDAAGSPEQKIYDAQLHEIDHGGIAGNLLCLYIPKVDDERLDMRDIDYMVEVFDVLVGEDGCPWDKEQTHESLERHLIEETYEVIEAIENGDDEAIVEEFGDILLQVALHSAIGRKDGFFDFYDVLESLTAKIIRRHPHVFGEEVVETREDLDRVWARAKQKEGKREKIKHEKAYGEIVLSWMKETIHEGKALDEILKEGGYKNET